MITLILICAAAILSGKGIDGYLDSFKGFDWKTAGGKLLGDIKGVCLKAGRRVAGMVLEMWYVLSAEETTLTDKILIYAAFIYLVTPLDLIPTTAGKIFGHTDEAGAVLLIYNKVKKNVTPEMRERARQCLDEWFGPEIEIIS